jgi:hypothetical protein
MTKPYLLLDVDGVLCPFKPTFTVTTGIESDYPDYEYFPREMIHVARETNGQRVRRLMDTYDIHWCTGWGDAANEIISPMHDLPELPVVPINEYSHEIHWKLSAIEAYVPADVPYAFVDDDITPKGVEYGNDREVPALWLPVKCDEGFTDEHVETLEAFALAVTSPSC